MDPLRELEPDLLRRLSNVRLVALDVDGVLTDGRVVYFGDDESQSFDVQDGQGLAWLVRAGVQLAWITGRGCRATERRAAELRVAHLHMRSGPKGPLLERIQAETGHGPDATLAMGDDLPDLALAARAGVFLAPANARPEVLARADLVTRAHGGRGAVREMCELVLAAQGKWDELTGGGR